MSRKRHSNKHIEAAVAYAEACGWRFVDPGGSAHAWGKLWCPFANRDGCKVLVYSTPRVPENHARHIRNRVDACCHRTSVEEYREECDQ